MQHGKNKEKDIEESKKDPNSDMIHGRNIEKKLKSKVALDSGIKPTKGKLVKDNEDAKTVKGASRNDKGKLNKSFKLKNKGYKPINRSDSQGVLNESNYIEYDKKIASEDNKEDLNNI